MLPRFARFRSLVGVILAGASLLRAAPTATEFFRRPDLTSPSVSKDGRYVAYLTRNNKKYYDLNLFDFTKREPLKFDLKGDDIMGYYWLDETQLVVTTEKPPIYSWRQIVFDVNRRTFTHNLTYSDVRYRIISAIKDRPGLFYAYFPVGAQRNQPEINVIDSVAGIRPEDRARLFQAFEQLETTSARRHEGTGLGLHLSQKLATLLGGHITCESEYGVGSRFTVVLPEKAA